MEQLRNISNLYILLQENSSYGYFSSDEPFNSVGIEERVFLHATLFFKFQYLRKQPEKLKTVINKTIQLWVASCSYGGYIDSGYLSMFFEFIDTEYLCQLVIDTAKELMSSNLTPTEIANLKKKYDFKLSRHQKRHNSYLDIIFANYVYLEEFDTAIDFFKESHIDSDKEMSLFYLVLALFRTKEYDYIVRVIEDAKKEGVKPRERLLQLHRRITVLGEEPDYI